MDIHTNHGGVIIQNHFSSYVLNDVVNSLSNIQKHYIEKHGFGSFLRINSFDVPLGLVQWIIQHTHVPSFQFQHMKKKIQITTSMVNYIFGFPSGKNSVSTTISEDSSSSTKILKQQYIANGMTTRQGLIDTLLHNEDEVSFIQQFVMLSIDTVLCPGLQNHLNLDYLCCVADISKIKSFNWNSHVLHYLGLEILKFHAYIDSFHAGYPSTKFNVCGCVPLLAVSNLHILFLYLFCLYFFHIIFLHLIIFPF